MPVNAQDRPIKAVRDQVIDQLIMNYSHNELSAEAFERRLDEAMGSDDPQFLMSLVEDLPLTADDAYQRNKAQNLGYQYQPDVEEQDRIINVLSGNTRGGRFVPAKEIEMWSFLSGASIDFSEADFQHPVVRIKLYSLLASDEIFVPENVNVITKASCVVGSVENRAGNYGGEGQPTIIIEGVNVLSSLEIKLKRTMKEKFMEFAESMKKMWM
ncbi:hypothetical protein [Paraferrimonas sedimenticola]|uniref:Cell wall-active antibiotics response LiaF-like C-terminal domain-containing protein n=1 Tax=Paraferrimonas sedimenticola TaxID=375674 RepID=A0AA37RRU9_9GAMM|nr:hypothetical protein [Paraferrimonas sedimenticola]GLP95101.1 hypothetical protein GCM10007895_04070 [Paraferrimonas sedimenticola]